MILSTFMKASYFVPMTNVLSELLAKFQKSAGLPRRTPSMASAAPRSSTHSPQFTQSTLAPLAAASFMIAAIHNGVGRRPRCCRF